MEDDPPILNITADLATLKRCDTVLAKGSDFNQKGEADIGRHRLRRSSASDRVDRHMALQWLRINGFGMIGDLQRFLLYLHECFQRLSLGQNNWPIACNKWFHHDCG